MTQAMRDLELLILEEPDDDSKLCDSFLHCIIEGRSPHPAHWTTLSPCGSNILVCETRRNLCRQTDGWQCVVGCNGYHPYDQIEWTPIDRS